VRTKQPNGNHPAAIKINPVLLSNNRTDAQNVAVAADYKPFRARFQLLGAKRDLLAAA